MKTGRCFFCLGSRAFLFVFIHLLLIVQPNSSGEKRKQYREPIHMYAAHIHNCLFQFVQIITDTFFISPKYTRNYFPFVWVFDIFGVHRKQRAQCTQVYCLSKFLLFRSFVVIVIVIINVLFLSIISNFGEGLGVTRKICTKTEFD